MVYGTIIIIAYNILDNMKFHIISISYKFIIDNLSFFLSLLLVDLHLSQHVRSVSSQNVLTSEIYNNY